MCHISVGIIQIHEHRFSVILEISDSYSDSLFNIIVHNIRDIFHVSDNIQDVQTV